MMKNTFCVCLFVCLIVLSACQSAPAAQPQNGSEGNTGNSSESQSGGGVSDAIERPQEQALTVRVEVLPEGDMQRFEMPSNITHTFGCEKDLKTYSEWLDNLNAASVTAIKMTYYDQGASNNGWSMPHSMSLEQSQRVFENLKTAVPDMMTVEGCYDVPAGGTGIKLSVETTAGRAIISYSGFMTVYLEGQNESWLFNAQTDKVREAYEKMNDIRNIMLESVREHSLSAALKIVMPDDNPQVYDTNGAEFELGTADDLITYNDWMDKLDVLDITGLYGYSVPVDSYIQSEMNLQDSWELVKKLKSVRPAVFASEEERGNPPTGGGISLSIITRSDRAVIGYNGAWLSVYLQDADKKWIFDVSKPENGQEQCEDIKYAIGAGMDKRESFDAELFYRGEKVEGLYAVNTGNLTMAEVETSAMRRRVLEELQSYTPKENSLNGLGYLVFTESGKEYVYLDNETNSRLNDYCSQCFERFALHPGWLIHMTPERIVSANGVTDKQKLLELSRFLKKEVTVGVNTKVLEGPDNPVMVDGLLTLTIIFDNGVKYTIYGYDYFDGTGEFSLHTSDLGKTASYKLEDGVAEKLNAFLENFK